MKRLAMIICLFTSGCAVGPDYSRPDLTLPQNWRNTTSHAPADAAWWEAFNDPVLKALQEEAMRHNLDLVQALYRIEQANAAAQTSNAASHPNIGADASLDRSRQSLNSREGVLINAMPDYERVTTQSSVGMSAVWDLDFSGAIRRQKEAASARRDAIEAGSEAVRIAVSAEVADAYFTLGTLQTQRIEAARNAALVQEQVIILRKRLAIGHAADSELSAALAEWHQAEAQLPSLDAGLETQGNRLALLLGRHPSTFTLPTIQAWTSKNKADPIASFPSDILRQRPDVRMAELQLVAANAGIGARLAEYYPQFSLGIFAGQSTSMAGELLSADSNFMNGGLGMRWRLFDFGRLDAQLKMARGKEREAMAAYMQAVLQASGEVESSIYNLRAARTRLRQLEQENAQVLTLQDSVSKSLAVGAIARQEKIDVDRRVADSNIRVAGARLEVARGMVACARALGGPMPKPTTEKLASTERPH